MPAASIESETSAEVASDSPSHSASAVVKGAMQKFDFVGEGPLGLELVDQKGEPPVVIKSIREGTQAETMGVQPNSVIVGINGQSADGMNRLQIVEALKVAGRPIHMLVLPSQALLDAKKAQDADAAASADKNADKMEVQQDNYQHLNDGEVRLGGF